MRYQRLAIFSFLILVCSLTAFPQDKWTQVKSPNFFLIGNASEKEIRKAGKKLEQFRETFRLLFPAAKLDSPTSTNVVVFKNDSAYKPFKPKRADGKADEWIAGYFQPGDDLNYITLAAGGDDRSMYGIIFHEYVHFIINSHFGKNEVPQWFNEGLAEYYQTFEIVDDYKIKLGLAQEDHLNLLQRSKLMPLEAMMKVSNAELHQNGNHSRSIFYAQSWALVHYLIQTDRTPALSSFLDSVLRGTDAKQAFEQAFKTTYAQMEADLRKYVSRNSYQYHHANLKQRLDFDSVMVASALTEAEANAYLGDLLYHNNRADDAEAYLINALRLDPNSSFANATLGMVKIRQRKYNEARPYLEKAISGDGRNHAAFYQYALLLSREAQDEFGFVRKFEADAVKKMREALLKAIELNPKFGESYELYAFISLVTNDEFDKAEKYLTTAIRSQPGNQRYAVRLAEVYARQKKFDEALKLAQRIAANPENDEIRNRASALATQIRQQQDFEAKQLIEKQRYEAALAESGGKPKLIKRIEGVPRPSDQEIARQEEEERIRAMNEALRKVENGEKRVLGKIEKIDCKKRPISFAVRTSEEAFTLTGRDFAGLALVSIDPAATNAELGCDANVSMFRALMTYREVTPPKLGIRGELVAIEFVPASFRLMTEEEMKTSTLVVWDMESSNPSRPIPSEEEIESKRREVILKGIRENLRVPSTGEKREIGFLEKIECTQRNSIFHFRSASRTIRLLGVADQPPNIVSYIPDLAGVQFGCGMKSLENPVVFVFFEKPDTKLKTEGTILSIEIVPQSFKLDQ